MNKNRFFFKWKISTIWFVSYIVVSLTAVLFNFFAYIRIDNSVSEQNEYYAREILEKSKNDADNLRKLISNVAIEISQKDSIRNLAFSKGSIDGKDYVSVINAMHELEVYKKLENEFDNIYVYFYNFDYCIGLNAAYGSDVYYEANIKPYGLTKSEWLKSMRDNQNGKFAVYSSAEGQKVTYFYSVYGTERFVPYATVAVETDSNKFLNISGDETYNGNLFIYDNEKILLAHDDEKRQAAEMIAAQSDINNSKKLVRDNFVMLVADSEDKEWKYFYLIDKKTFTRTVNHARMNIVIFNLIGTVIMLMIALFLVRFNYNPIKKIIDTVGGMNKKNESEFQYIQSKISSVMNENLEIRHRVDSIDNDYVRDAVLSRLMSERLSDAEREKMLDTLVNVGIIFPYSNFVVMLFYIDINLDMFFDNSRGTEENYRLARVAIINIVSEILADKCKINYCNLSGGLCGVVNLKNGGNMVEIIEKIKWIQEFTLKNLNVNFMVGISNVHFEISELGVCLNEAMECVKERMYHENSVICYNELEERQNTEYCLPGLVEEQLVELLRSGNTKSALKIIDGLFDYRATDKVKSIHALKYISYNLIIVINRAFGSNESFDGEKMSELVKMTENLEFDQDVDNLHRKFCDIIKTAGEQNSIEMTKKIDVTLECAKSFVDGQYMDINMSVTAVAQEVNVSLQYLSTNFKKRYRIGLSEYITLVRIEHAKELLVNTNIPIADISQKVGYVNPRSFFRNFMRIVGTSPKEYRNMK